MAGYATPAWTNNSTPAIDAASLTAIGQGIELSEHPYGVCSTSASTAAKTVTIDFSGTLTLFTGMSVRVKFSNANTAASPTLNVNGTGAKPILFGTGYRGSWIAGAVAVLTYDGTNWVMSMPFGIDSTPTDGSANLVSSTGINSALSDLKSTTCNPNLLDNWYFLNPINQRGQTIYANTSTEYTVDRWLSRGDMQVTVGEDGLRLSTTSESLKLLQQPSQQLLKDLAGKTVTASVLVRDFDVTTTTSGSSTYPRIGIYSAASYGYTSHGLISGPLNGNGLFSVTGVLTPTSGDTFLQFAIHLNNGTGSMTVVAAKLEIGDHQTLAHLENGEWKLNAIQDPTTELLKCQRYYLPLNPYVRYPATRWINSEIDFLIPVPVKMPKVPAIDGAVSVISGNTVQTGFTFTVPANGANAIAIRATKSSHGLTPANQVSLQVDQSIGCALTAEK